MSLLRKMSSTSTAQAAASGLISYIAASPSPFHAVSEAARRLEAAGYRRISEKDVSWDKVFVPNAKLYFTRNQSTLVAFAVGGAFKPGNGFSVVGAHTDSPNLRVKPISKITSQGFAQVGVETYGGGLWNTWFDRDLSLAGRVIVATDDSAKKFESRLVNLKDPILNIPSLAIHLNRGIYEEGFKPNFETHTVPILATLAKQELEVADLKDAEATDAKHSPLLLKLLSKELKVPISAIRDFELSLYDVNPPQLTGATKEFVSSPRLDNLCMSYCSLQALINSESSLKADTNIRVVALFDHEEIGSESAQGAASNLLNTVFNRIQGSATDIAIRNSLLVSADMAHGIHPNYPEKHESNHRPKIHGGLVIKENCKQRYATNSVSSFILKELARRRKLPVQDFVVRNDVGCGSTIGPILAGRLGIRTVDVGIPQFAMHSIRELCGTEDVASAIALLEAFFEEFPALDASLVVD